MVPEHWTRASVTNSAKVLPAAMEEAENSKKSSSQAIEFDTSNGIERVDHHLLSEGPQRASRQAENQGVGSMISCNAMRPRL